MVGFHPLRHVHIVLFSQIYPSKSIILNSPGNSFSLKGLFTHAACKWAHGHTSRSDGKWDVEQVISLTHRLSEVLCEGEVLFGGWKTEVRQSHRGSRNAKRLMGDWEEWDSKPLIVADSREDQQSRGKGVEDRVGLQRPWWDMRVRVPSQLPGHCLWMPMMETAWNLPQPGVEVCIQIQFRKTLT